MHYDELQYQLPDTSATDAAQRAVAVLEAVLQADESYLFYVIQPSNILALAGLRVQSPYNEFAPGFSEDKQRLLAKLLESQGCSLQSNSNDLKDGQDKARAVFSVISQSALRALPEQYKAVSDIVPRPLVYQNEQQFEQWNNEFERHLTGYMATNRLPKKWLHDEWSAHDIRFGMLLGYPGPAIASLCWFYAKHKERDLAWMEMPYQGWHAGTHVGYEYAPELTDNEVLKQHAKLWRDTLRGVYKVFSKQRLAGIPGFVAEAKRCKAYEKKLRNSPQ